MSTATWKGHEFEVCRPNDNWNDISGIYIFSMLTDNLWKPLYIGQTDSFRNRFADHEKWTPAVRMGMTHIHAKCVSSEREKDKIEKDLISTYKPPLNDQLK